MPWTSTPPTWPPSAASIETAAAPALAAIPGAGNDALARLNQAAAGVAFNRHPLSEQASALLSLRDQWAQLLAHGHRLTVTPYDHDVGISEESGHYLAPNNAAARLAEKLQDAADRQRPTGPLYALGILVAATSLAEFAAALATLTAMLPLP
ncbi:hypothetical protein CGX12_16560, partial [Zobellella denitrificans]